MPAPIPSVQYASAAFGEGILIFADATARLETGADGQPIDITWGRRDRDSEVQVSTFSFILNNFDGLYTDPAQDRLMIGYQVRVRVTHNAITYPRAYGYIESIDLVWPGQVGSFSTIRVNCVDVSAVLADALELRSFLEYEILADSPAAFWPCSEPMGALVGNIAETAAGSGRILTARAGGNTFGVGADPVIEDEVTSFATECAGASGDYRAAGIRFPDGTITTYPFTVEMMFAATPGDGSGLQVLYAMPRGNDIGDFVCRLELAAANGAVTFYVQADSDSGGSGNNVGTGAAPVYNYADGNYHHAVFGLMADGFTPFLYLDGTAQTVFNLPTGTPFTLAKLLRANPYIGIPTVGISNGNGYSFAPGLNGRAGMLALYPGLQLSGARILAHYNAATGRQGESTTDRFTKIAALGGVTVASLPTPLGTMGPQQLAGLPAIEALRVVARTEGGPMLVTGAGVLTFQGRDHRYNPVSTFSVDAGQINPDLLIRRDRDGLVNDQSYTRYNGGQQRFLDQSSIDAYGRRTGGGGEIAPATDEDARQHAAWDVTVGAAPQLRMSTVTFDLLTQPVNATVAAVLNATVSTPFTVTALPAQSPDGTSFELFVEGGHERIGVDTWDIELYTSPQSAYPDTLIAGTGGEPLTKLDAGIKVAY